MNADQRESAYATLRFVGDGLDPGVISAALDLQPTFSVRNGEAYRRGRGEREYVSRTGVWNLSSKEAVRSDRLQDHLDFFVELLSARPDRIAEARKIVQDHEFRAGIFCFWYGPPGAEPIVPNSFRSLVAQVGGEVDLDFYPDDELRERAAAE